jgi:chromosome condensin MukBEF ATPase and DNA-binding subunit MukB
MSNVTPIRPDTCAEYPRISVDAEHVRRMELARAFFSRDVSDAELQSTRRERDTLKQRITILEADLRTQQRTAEKAERHALDTGRIQGMIACSAFVALGLTIASIWAI